MTISPNIVSLNDKLTYTSKDSLCETTCDHCIVRHISMCSVLQKDEINELSKISTDLVKNSKQTIFSEGDDADYLYNIREGCVRIIKMLADGRRQITGFLFAGDFFGLACNSGYSYSVEAVTDVDLCRIPRTKIIQKFHEMPTLGQKVFELTRTELQSAQEQMLLLGRKTAKEKLCSFLLAMHQKPKLIEGMLDNQVYLPMSRSDIADYLGLTIETVSRQFTLLSKDGVIELDGNSIATILSQERLCSIAACE